MHAPQLHVGRLSRPPSYSSLGLSGIWSERSVESRCSRIVHLIGGDKPSRSAGELVMFLHPSPRTGALVTETQFTGQTLGSELARCHPTKPDEVWHGPQSSRQGRQHSWTCRGQDRGQKTESGRVEDNQTNSRTSDKKRIGALGKSCSTSLGPRKSSASAGAKLSSKSTSQEQLRNSISP